MQDIERILTDADVKPTAIRMMVMKEIIAIGHTFTLSDMEIRLETVDRSTLFRTLTLFLEHKLLHEVDNGSGSKIYCRCECRSTHTSHIHFTCTSCGKTFCIKDIDTSSIPHPEGFTIEETSCVMKGFCPDCTIKNGIPIYRSVLTHSLKESLDHTQPRLFACQHVPLNRG